MKPRSRAIPGVCVGLLLAAPACGSRRNPRPTLLNSVPPAPPPESNEARLLAVELRPDAPEPIETAPGSSLESMARRALDGAQSSVVRCYEELLVRSPSASGSVEVQLDLSSEGSVTRAHLDHRAGDGLDGMLPCLEGVFRGLRVRSVDPGDRYVSRVYTFQNPPVERVVQTPVAVAAPPRPPRARPRRGAPTTPPPAPATPTAPQPGPGSLRAEELTNGLADVPALRACAPLALRRGRRGGALTLHMTVGGDGSVSEARLEGPPPPPANVATCVADAARTLRFRASGIVVRARVPLTFRR